MEELNPETKAASAEKHKRKKAAQLRATSET